MNRPPIISVIMPVYNAERYLEDAIRSILCQSFVDFEFLIVNDGSTDSSKDIIDKFASMDSRIRSWDRDNDGLVSALNFMLDKANGQYIARMDADDIALPERFALQEAAFKQDLSLVLVGGQIELIDADSRRIGLILQPYTHDEIDGFHLRGHTSVCHPMSMFRRDAIQAVGGYREAFICAEDLDLWLRLGEFGQMRNLEETVLYYRVHDESVSSQRQAEQADAAMRACQAAWERRGVIGQYACEFSNERSTLGKTAKYKLCLKYAWMAWKHGHRSTWWHYSLRAIKLGPLRLDSWKVLFFGLIRRPKGGS